MLCAFCVINGTIFKYKAKCYYRIKNKGLREAKYVTLEVFYFDTGIHLARIEQGKTNITVSTLKRICDYLETNLGDFFKDLDIST